MSEFVKSLIDAAHVNFLSRNYDEAVRQLKSVKLRVKKKELLGRMQQKGNMVDLEYKKRYKTIDADNAVEEFNKVMALKEWKAKELISFYDKLNVEIP